MQLSFFIQFINYRRTTCKIKCPEDDEIEKSNELPTLIWRQQIHKIIELYKWSYLISLIIYIPYLTHYQFITFGIYFERRSFIIRFPKMSMTSQFFFKKDFLKLARILIYSYHITLIDLIHRSQIYRRGDISEGLMRKINPLLLSIYHQLCFRKPITVTLYFTTGFPLLF